MSLLYLTFYYTFHGFKVGASNMSSWTQSRLKTIGGPRQNLNVGQHFMIFMQFTPLRIEIFFFV